MKSTEKRTRKKYLGYNKNRKTKAKDEGQLPDQNKTFLPGPNGQLKKIAKMKR